MTSFNPNWESYLAKDYAKYIDENTLKYRSDEIDAIEAWLSENPTKYPAEIEIGSNRGRFLLGLARARKDAYFLGIELKSSLVRISNNKLRREGLSHAKVINADARIALPMLFKPQSVDAIYVLFPDPWWKKKHAKRKLLNEEFFALMHSFLKPHGVFVLKTDVLDYFNDVKELIASLPTYKLIEIDDVPHHESWELTTRERHCVKDGTPFYALGALRLA
ncbi:MAG: tRNA (guanosine(46)-N7)-methyltransferase TrmB [Bradymonadales bacterium]|jgi:tRNA (guanine-N7-)-methyltransferase